MSRGKKPKKNTGYSENNPRTEIENAEASAARGHSSLFSCCTKKPARTKENLLDSAYDNYDYIVEKLVVKRVPIALFATPYDDYESEGKERNPDDSNPVADSQKVYPIVHAVNSSLFYTSANSAGPSGFPNRSSNKTLRFTRTEDVFDDDALNATTSAYNDNTKSRFRDTELLNRFTALHPNLKESERAPKDPCPLNITRSRRSLAEEISEIAAKRDSPNLHFERTRNELVTTGSVYAARPGTSGELSSPPAVEIIPTRDKAEEIATPMEKNRYRAGSSSCFPFGWRSESRDDDTEAGTSISRTEESLTDVQDSSGTSKNCNYIIAPVQVHYSSPNLENIRKIINERNRVEAAPGNKEKSNFEILGKGSEKIEHLGESSTDENSETAEEPRNKNLTGTTLRWKFIIKHHPPSSSNTFDTKNGSSQPILSKRMREVIEARKQRDSASCNNDRGGRRKNGDEVPKRSL